MGHQTEEVFAAGFKLNAYALMSPTVGRANQPGWEAVKACNAAAMMHMPVPVVSVSVGSLAQEHEPDAESGNIKSIAFLYRHVGIRAYPCLLTDPPF